MLNFMSLVYVMTMITIVLWPFCIMGRWPLLQNIFVFYCIVFDIANVVFSFFIQKNYELSKL